MSEQASRYVIDTRFPGIMRRIEPDAPSGPAVFIDDEPYPTLDDACEEHYGDLALHRIRTNCPLSWHDCTFTQFAGRIADIGELLRFCTAMDEFSERQAERAAQAAR